MKKVVDDPSLWAHYALIQTKVYLEWAQIKTKHAFQRRPPFRIYPVRLAEKQKKK